MTQIIEDVRPDEERWSRVPLVLMYHSVSSYTEDPYLVTVTPARFEHQLRWLSRRGLRGTSMRELLAARRRGTAAGLVGLTFDDGYADFADQVVPALQRHGFTATVFVVAGRLGGHNAWDEAGERKPLMSAEQVREVAERGMEIGSHGLRHVPLPALPGGRLLAEVVGSRELLRALTGEEVSGFCYPYGQLDAAALGAVRDAGYDYACTVGYGEPTGRYTIPRTYVGDRDGPLRLLAKRYRHHRREGAHVRVGILRDTGAGAIGPDPGGRRLRAG